MKKDEPNVLLWVGYEEYLMPASDAYAAHRCFCGTLVKESVWLGDTEYFYFRPAGQVQVRTKPEGKYIVGVETLTPKEKDAYISAVKTAADLAGEGFEPFTVEQWKERKHEI